MRLLSNNPRKLVALEGYGLSVAEWLPLEIPASASTLRYLTTKKNKLGGTFCAGSDLACLEKTRRPPTPKSCLEVFSICSKDLVRRKPAAIR